MTTKEKIAVMQAFENGEVIQWKVRSGDSRGSYCAGSSETSDPMWNWASFDYSIKPEPRVIYVNEYANKHYGAHASPQVARDAALNAIRTAVRFVESPE